jgi:hypothetical protein
MPAIMRSCVMYAHDDSSGAGTPRAPLVGGGTSAEGSVAGTPLFLSGRSQSEYTL